LDANGNTASVVKLQQLTPAAYSVANIVPYPRPEWLGQAP